VRGFGAQRFNATVKESKPGEIESDRRRPRWPAAAAMEFEQAFLAGLGKAKRYTFVAGQLALSWQDGDRVGTLAVRK